MPFRSPRARLSGSVGSEFELFLGLTAYLRANCSGCVGCRVSEMGRGEFATGRLNEATATTAACWFVSSGGSWQQRAYGDNPLDFHLTPGQAHEATGLVPLLEGAEERV